MVDIEEIDENPGTRGGTMTFVVMTTELRDGSGALVAEARMMTGGDRTRARGGVGVGTQWDDLLTAWATVVPA